MLVALASSCAPEKTYTTPVFAALPSGDFLEQCLGTTTASGFRVDVFEFTGNTDDAGVELGETACGRCADSDIDCRRLFTECRCSGPRSTADAIIQALSGMRFEGLEPDMPLCARVTVYDRPTADGSSLGPAEACDCDDAQTGDLSVCALSDLGAVNESETPLAIREFQCGSPVGCGFIDCDLLSTVGGIDCSLFTNTERRMSCEGLVSFANSQEDRCCGVTPAGVAECASF